MIRLPNWLGDVVMSTAFVQSVRQLYPQAQIDVIIKKELMEIAGLIPNLHKVYSFSKKDYPGLRGVYSFGKTLREEKYDLFFCLPDSLSSALMGWATASRKRIGFSKEGRFFLLTNSYKRPIGLHRTDEYISLLEKFADKRITERSVKLSGKKPGHRDDAVLINFNSEAVSRRMPVDKGIRLMNMLTNSFKSTRFIVIGAPKEKEYVDELLRNAENSDRLQNYAGKTSLEGLCNLMTASKALLTTDSGPAHLANGLGLPTVVLFGAGDEHNTAPYNKQYLTVIRAGLLACEPCVRNTCKLYGIPKCLQLLDEMQIVNALSLYLNHA